VAIGDKFLARRLTHLLRYQTRQFGQFHLTGAGGGKWICLAYAGKKPL
jgi:hypothetical protein